MSRIGLILAGGVFVLFMASCDVGDPPAAEQMLSLGLPVESAFRVDADTVVTVRMAGEKAELLIYRPHSFGGDEVNVWPAAMTSASGTEIGNGYSQRYDDRRNEGGPGYCYLFGAGTGPIGDIEVSDPEARWQIVNDEIDAWVIVMPEEEEQGGLDWQLIGPDGDLLDSGRGFPGLSYRCAES